MDNRYAVIEVAQHAMIRQADERFEFCDRISVEHPVPTLCRKLNAGRVFKPFKQMNFSIRDSKNFVSFITWKQVVSGYVAHMRFRLVTARLKSQRVEFGGVGNPGAADFFQGFKKATYMYYTFLLKNSVHGLISGDKRIRRCRTRPVSELDEIQPFSFLKYSSIAVVIWRQVSNASRQKRPFGKKDRRGR